MRMAATISSRTTKSFVSSKERDCATCGRGDGEQPHEQPQLPGAAAPTHLRLGQIVGLANGGVACGGRRVPAAHCRLQARKRPWSKKAVTASYHRRRCMRGNVLASTRVSRCPKVVGVEPRVVVGARGSRWRRGRRRAAALLRGCGVTEENRSALLRAAGPWSRRLAAPTAGGATHRKTSSRRRRPPPPGNKKATTHRQVRLLLPLAAARSTRADHPDSMQRSPPPPSIRRRPPHRTAPGDEQRAVAGVSCRADRAERSRPAGKGGFARVLSSCARATIRARPLGPLPRPLERGLGRQGVVSETPRPGSLSLRPI